MELDAVYRIRVYSTSHPDTETLQNKLMWASFTRSDSSIIALPITIAADFKILEPLREVPDNMTLRQLVMDPLSANYSESLQNNLIYHLLLFLVGLFE